MPFFNEFQKNNIIHGAPGREAPPSDLVKVIPDNTKVYDPPLRGILCGQTGHVAVLSTDRYMRGESTPVIMPVVGGINYPGYFSKIYADATDVVEIVGYY